MFALLNLTKNSQPLWTVAYFQHYLRSNCSPSFENNCMRKFIRKLNTKQINDWERPIVLSNSLYNNSVQTGLLGEKWLMIVEIGSATWSTVNPPGLLIIRANRLNVWRLFNPFVSRKKLPYFNMRIKLSRPCFWSGESFSYVNNR